MAKDFPFLGFGLGLRTEHVGEILSQKPNIDWFEIITENYMVPGGKPHFLLRQIVKHYPIAMHGVSLSIGGTDSLNLDYLSALKKLINDYQPVFVSDHLCWTGIDKKNSHDLLPLPYNEEALTHVCQRILQVQDFLQRPILIENVSSYVQFVGSEMTEWQFLTEVTKKTDCYLLLDINNIYVNSVNHHFNPLDFLNGVPVGRVKQHHLAGHLNCNHYIIDTHDAAIVDSVWQLYEKALKRFGLVSINIERDANMPPLAELLAELNQARKIAKKVLTKSKALSDG